MFSLPIPPELARTLDPHLGLAWSLIGTRDWDQLKSRFGIDQQSLLPQSLPLFIDFGSRAMGNDTLRSALVKLKLDVPEFYYKERESNTALSLVTARIALVPGNPGQVQDRERGQVPLDEQLLAILQSGLVQRISIARSHQPCLRDSIRDIGMLPGRKHKGQTLSGQGIVIGIIDDGCAFAHPHFLKTVRRPIDNKLIHMTRIRHLWDQSAAPSTTDLAVGWKMPAVPFNPAPPFPPAVPYGRELNHPSIDLAIAANTSADGRIDEDAIYEALNYQVGEPGNLASHGTHVMDIAAGNGHSLIGAEGVAPGAEIIFVQLPVVDINLPGPALDQHIVDGVAYIFSKAGTKPAVVNISYGGYSGPHDGTSAWESQIDALIANNDNRAVVVSAGNGFEAECHASGEIAAGTSQSLHWIVKPEDATHNDIEVWYDGTATLTIALTEPDTGNTYGPYPLGAHEFLHQTLDGRTIGHVDHASPGINGDSAMLVALHPTDEDFGDPNLAPARSGEWIVTLTNAGLVHAPFHAWIQRDDIGPSGGRRQQSRFAPQDVDPAMTIADFATGHHTIAVGAYNARTHEIARYSACGPTRPGRNFKSRPKPDICAPAAEDVAGRGVLSASSLRATPTRMGGTSAAAPHVTGMVALILEYSMKHGTKSIHVDTIRANLAATMTNRLQFNRHQEADDRVTIKQRDVWADVIGEGRIDFAATMHKLFP